MRRVFEIKINNGQPIRAGLDVDKYVVNCILNAVCRRIDPKEELSITISGLNSIDEEQVDWLKADLQLADNCNRQRWAKNREKLVNRQL